MKIAICYGGYLPGEKYGGPVVSIYNFTELLGDDNEIYILCSNHDLKDTTPYTSIKKGWNIVGKAYVIYLSDAEYVENRIFEIFDEIEPDLVYMSSIFSVKFNWPIYKAAKKKSLPILLAPRGELNYNALKIKRMKKSVYIFVLKFFKFFLHIYFQATSKEEYEDIAKVLGIDRKKIILLPNVPAIPVSKTKIEKRCGNLKICYVGRIVENKNLLLALNAILLSKHIIQFDIIGPVEDQNYWEQCKNVIKSAPKNISITYKGICSHLLLNELYSNYDCFISPTLFENYGQAIVEAMLHDVPVIISRGTTPWDDVTTMSAGFTVPIGNIEEFSEKIEKLAEMDESQYRELIGRLREYCLNKFQFTRLKKQYLDAFASIVDQPGGQNESL